MESKPTFDATLALLAGANVKVHLSTWHNTWGSVAAEDIPMDVQAQLVEKDVEIGSDEQYDIDLEVG